MRYLLAVVACAACAASEPQEAPRFVPASREIAPDEHNGICFAALTAARCDHEQNCGFIEQGKLFRDRDTCLNHYNSLGYLSLQSCNIPIDRQQLRECIISIKSADCGSPAVDIGAFEACNYGALCRGLL